VAYKIGIEVADFRRQAVTWTNKLEEDDKQSSIELGEALGYSP
jgi:hypothetical protein